MSVFVYRPCQRDRDITHVSTDARTDSQPGRIRVDGNFSVH